MNTMFRQFIWLLFVASVVDACETQIGVFSNWSPWECNVDCGIGQLERSTSCVPEDLNDFDASCPLFCMTTMGQEAVQTGAECDAGCCGATAGVLSDWTEWDCSGCDNAGTPVRDRTCEPADPDTYDPECGLDCPAGDLQQTDTCDIEACQPASTWSNWSEWTCPPICGTSNQTRFRQCMSEDLSQTTDTCIGEATEVVACTMNVCPQTGTGPVEMISDTVNVLIDSETDEVFSTFCLSCVDASSIEVCVSQSAWEECTADDPVCLFTYEAVDDSDAVLITSQCASESDVQVSKRDVRPGLRAILKRVAAASR